MNDSQHWYLPDGRPFYSVLSKDGTERAVTLRDARKVNAVPSVTTVLQIIAKPQLVRWQREQVALSALTLPRIDGETSAELLARIDADSGKQAKDAADEGTRIHDAIERSFKDERYVPHSGYKLHVEAVRAEIRRLFPTVNDWVSEKSFAHELGFGGKVDLHSPSLGIVIDFKGKDGDFSDGKQLAYDQHWQLAAYNRGLRLPHSTCANIFVSRTHPGAVCSHVWHGDDVAYGWGVFEDALRLWKRLKKYESSTLSNLDIAA